MGVALSSRGTPTVGGGTHALLERGRVVHRARAARHSPVAMMLAPEAFRRFIAARGFEPPERIEPDRWCPFSTNGKRGDDAGRAKLFRNGEGGIVYDWRTRETWIWQAQREPRRSEAEQRAWRERIERERREAEALRQEGERRAAERAKAIWSKAQPAPADHAYLAAKRVQALGLRLYRGPLAIGGMRCDGALLVPMQNAAGDMVNLQFIAPNGDKRFLPGGRKAGACSIIGKPEGAIAIAEGFATGASIHESSGLVMAVAFDAGNLGAVASELRTKYPEARIIVCGDDDYRTEGNPGLTKAREAARAVGALLAVPDFGANRPDGATDFNDMARERGADAVARAVRDAKPASELENPKPPPGDGGAQSSTGPQAEAGDGWPEPQPLVAKIEAEPYPVDGLPATIRAAVEEVQVFTKAPVPLVASSALAALSIAAQAHYDVKRSEKLQGPTSLFLLTIADSGERKSTCDAFFAAAIRDYEGHKAQEAKPVIARHVADVEAWQAKRDGIKAKIRDETKRGKPTNQHEAALRDLENAKPQPPQVPRLLRGDDTPENLAFVLAREWPSAGIACTEGGAIFGAHGMGRDSIMRNLALLNILWENGTLSIGRRTSESFTLRGARLTVALQVQEATLRNFFDRSQGLARGTGFLARFLVAWPESTQGTRTFTEAPPTWPALAAFNRKIAAILSQPAPIGEDGALSPAVLMLAPEAKAAWIAFHDAIEAELRTGGELYDVRDVASKCADNAVRLAALFQVFEHGIGAAVGPECFAGAARIAAWHLLESRRFFGELALPAELANAARLDGWLIDYGGRERTHIVPRRTVQRFGPPGLRAKAPLSEALRELEESGRVREIREGRRKDILVNPALLPWGKP